MEFLPWTSFWALADRGITRCTGLYLADTIVWDRTIDYNNDKPLGWNHRWFWRRTNSYILVFRKPK